MLGMVSPRSAIRPRTPPRQMAPVEVVAGRDVEHLGLGLAPKDVPPARIILAKVVPREWAAQNGMQPGAEIVALNGQAVAGMTPDQFRQTLQRRPLRLAYLPAGGRSATPPRSPRAQAQSKSPRGGVGGFFDRMRGQGGGGGYEAGAAVAHAPNAQAAGKLAEIVLECTHAVGVDVAAIPLKYKCLVLTLPGPWIVGRQQQPQLFVRLVSDEPLRSCISRSHLELAWEPPNLRLDKLSPNLVLLNGAPVTHVGAIIGPGAQIGFCGRDNKTPFLVFNVLFRDAATVAAAGPTPLPEHPDVPCLESPSSNKQQELEQSQRMRERKFEEQRQQLQRQQEQLQALQYQVAQQNQYQHDLKTTQQQLRQQEMEMKELQRQLQHQPEPQRNVTEQAPSTPCYLVCTLAQDGCDPAAQPREVKVIPVPETQRMTVGRTSQPGFFEGLLGPTSKFLTFVSRSHFDLTPLPGRTCVFEITNLSANPIVLLQQQHTLQQGQRGIIDPNSSIDFISRASPADPSPRIYFRFVLEKVQNSNGRGQQQLGAEEMVRALPTTAAPQGAGVDAFQPCPDATFWLEMAGSTVRPECTPEQRRIAGADDGVTVGRSYQPQILMQALREEVIQFISREQFRVERSGDGSCRLASLSSNPMWRVRAGCQAEVRRGQPPLPLADGDCVQIFTGARDCTPDGPGSVGTLYWRLLLPGDAVSGEWAPAQPPREDRSSFTSSGGFEDTGIDRRERRSNDFYAGPPDPMRSRGSSVGYPGTQIVSEPQGTVLGLHEPYYQDVSEVGTVPLRADPYGDEFDDGYYANSRMPALPPEHLGGILRAPVTVPLDSEESCGARDQERYSLDSDRGYRQLR